MPHAIGSVDDTFKYANQSLLEFLLTFVSTNGWTILESDLASDTRYWIAEGPGYTGPDGPVKVYAGMRSYQNVASDYYNVSVAAFTGYVAGNSFTTQPGYRESGIPAHNQRIDYWASINERRLTFALKVGTPVYECGYVGLMLPYTNPRQHPYPMISAGMLNGAPGTRFSDTSHSFPWKGNRAGLAMRWVDGSWLTPYVHPWSNANLAGSNGIRPTGAYYPLLKMILHNNGSNIFGELDGVYYITGFDNVVENTLTIDGVDYVVIQDVSRTGFVDYYALRLDP